MKTARIEHHLFYNGGTAIELRIPTEADKTGKITKITNCTTCRELAVGYFAGFMVEKASKMKKMGKKRREEYIEAHKEKIKWASKKARVILPSLSKKFADAIEAGKTLNVLNMLEDKVGWPRTEVYKFEKAYKQQRRRYMFVGSNRWFRSSHMMSLWMLLIRLGVRSNSFRQDSWEALEEDIKKFPQKNNYGSNTLSGDQYYARLSMKNWVNLLKNLDKIFPANTKWIDRLDSTKVHQKPSKNIPYINSIGTEGISKLMLKKSHHVHAKRFYKIMEK